MDENKKETTTDIVAIETDVKPVPIANESQSITPLRLIEMALSTNADIDKLEKLLELKERWDKEQARKSFIKSMSDFQSECPIIIKSTLGGLTREGTVAYKFASLDQIVTETKELIHKNGFSFMMRTKTLETTVEVTCIVKHIDGHSEETTITLPLAAKTGVMSPPQVVAATLTYAKRYSFCNAFGIMTGEQDTDGAIPLMYEEFESIIKDWEYKDEYIIQTAKRIKNGNTFYQFLHTLPTQDQTDKFIELVKLIPEAKRKDAWLVFQKNTNETATTFIEKLTDKLITNKGEQNEK